MRCLPSPSAASMHCPLLGLFGSETELLGACYRYAHSTLRLVISVGGEAAGLEFLTIELKGEGCFGYTWLD
jgi:hypothetical protein